jgi:hypothetical protein
MKNQLQVFTRRFALGTFAVALLASQPSYALDLDWSGQFRSEAIYIRDYNLENGTTVDNSRLNRGYYIPGGGQDNAQFQTLFMRLNPKVIVNDNVVLKSEWWVGDPSYGIFGSGQPQGVSSREFSSRQSRGSSITAQRFWGEFQTDFGVLQVGRAPLHWGLGLVWNSGDRLFDRMPSTGDSVRLISKFGSFVIAPGAVKYSAGNAIGGSCTVVNGACTPTDGGGGLSEYSLAFKYQNMDEDFEGGVNFIRRIGGGSQTGYQIPVVGGSTFGTINATIWDLYGKKKIGPVTIAGEVPIISGTLGGVPYKTYGAAVEGDWQISETWATTVKAGNAPGQPNVLGTAVDNFKLFSFNPNYTVGSLVMFNYAFQNFAGPNTQNDATVANGNLANPYDNPIANARYLSAGLSYRADKWKFYGNYITARANETAIQGTRYYNTFRRQYETATSGVTSQSGGLGWEMNYGANLQWDDHLQFGLGLGWWIPGEFYKYSSTINENNRSSVFLARVHAGVSF